MDNHDLGRHGRCGAIEGKVYTRSFKTSSTDILIRVPENHYFRTRCIEISMTMVHLSEKQLTKSLILREIDVTM